MLQVIPDSQFFTSLRMIENYLLSKRDRDEYLLLGIMNTIEKGYEMVLKQPDMNLRKGRGVYASRPEKGEE